jgi:hypothetical protein
MKCAVIWSTTAMLVDLGAHAKDVEEQMGQIREDLGPLEAGKMTIGGGRRPLARRHAGHEQAQRVLARTY